MDAATLIRVLFGVAIWIGLILFGKPVDELTSSEGIQSLMMLGLMPLGIALSRTASEHLTNAFKTARYLQPFAAVIAVSSFLLPPGILAGTLAITWLPVTGLFALAAMQRLRESIPKAELGRICGDIGMLFLPVGAFFFWASRMNLQPFDLSKQQVLLSSIHFHYAVFGALLLTALTGRFMQTQDREVSPLFKLSAVLMLFSTIFIISTHFIKNDFYTALSVGIQFSGFCLLAYIQIRRVIPNLEFLPAKILILISGLSGVLSMLVVVSYAIGRASNLFYYPADTIITVHGWLIAGGFIAAGKIGWWLIENN